MADKKTTSYPKEKINILFLENISKTAVKKFTDAGYNSVKTNNRCFKRNRSDKRN